MKKYGGTEEAGGGLCPGETSCERFQSAKGKTHDAKERNACRSCPLLETKAPAGRKHRASLEQLVEAASYARRRRDSGYPLSLSQIGHLEFEVMMIIDEAVHQKEIGLKLRQSQMLMAGFGLRLDS